MPAFPFSGLVFTHSAVVLGFLKISFDPVPLGLHVRQSFMRFRCIGVAQAVCKISIRIASYDQMPAMSSVLFPIPKPNPSMENLNPQLSFGGVADERFFPTRRRLLFDPFINPDRFALGLWFCWFTSFIRRWRRNYRFRVFKIDALSFGNVHHEDLVHLIHHTREGCVFPI